MNYSEKNNFSFKKFLKLWLSLLLFVTFIVNTYVYILPRVEQIVYTESQSDKLPVINNIINSDQKKNSGENKGRGLRTSKINVNTNLPNDVTEKVNYKDVDFVSTAARPFQPNEIKILELIIDEMPQTLYEYRPWAIISIDFSTNSITKVNPEGVAFASGPYIYVSDITFKRSNGYDTGTMRGLSRILYHEFTHIAQFFTTLKVPENSYSNYLESSEMVKDWVSKQGWTKENGEWVLDDNQTTTKYGRTDPIEDQADSMGALLIGDEFAVSNSRNLWLYDWLKTEKDVVLAGTIPISAKLEQKVNEPSDNVYLQKYEDKTALMQDLMNFQYKEVISKKNLAIYYNAEFAKRGWLGSINSNGVGEFKYKNLYKVNIEMNENVLRVATMVMTTY